MRENSHGEQEAEAGFINALDLPSQLLILPMRTGGVFPGVSGSLSVGKEALVRVVEAAFASEKLIGLVALRAAS